jgi:hypothetical protein
MVAKAPGVPEDWFSELAIAMPNPQQSGNLYLTINIHGLFYFSAHER